MGTPSPQFRTSPDIIIQRLSYSHLELLVDLNDDLKRAFYELECIRGNWSVRELKRQNDSLYYERSGLSKDRKKLAALAQEGEETGDPKQTIRDPYVLGTYYTMARKQAVDEYMGRREAWEVNSEQWKSHLSKLTANTRPSPQHEVGSWMRIWIYA